MDSAIRQRQRDVRYDLKWKKFLRRSRLLRHIPFVEFAFGAGSMAFGNVADTSDFDLLIGARAGRIFTARIFSAFFFSLFGWRRRRGDQRERAANKICLNHFVTPSAYQLSVAPNEYWQRLYRNLVPLYGEQDKMEAFFEANKNWLSIGFRDDLRYQVRTSSFLKRIVERVFIGRFGNWFEQKVKTLQVRRIEAGLRAGAGKSGSHTITLGKGVRQEAIHLPPLVTYTDNELQFHPDPVVIELRS